MTIHKLYRKSLEKLKRVGINNYLNEIKWIFESEGISQKDIIAYPQKKMKWLTTIRILRKVQKRSKRYPLQYILGYEEFMGLKFMVNSNVLIPRPETEILVKEAVKIIPLNAKVIDVGCGSGVIGISLKYYREDLDVVISDISRKVLKVAKKNIELILRENAIRIIQSDLFSKVDEKFDVIISNPPYIVEEEKKYMDPEVLFEPKVSLFCKYKGEFYERILLEGVRVLKRNGLVMFELGMQDHNSIKKLFQNNKIINENYRLVKMIKDFNGINRVCIIRFIS